MKTAGLLYQLGGVPVLGSDMPFITGSAFFVDALNGNDANKGDKDSPWASIDYALSRCTADAGDGIFLLPNSQETITLSTDLAADKDGVSIIGLGRYESQPSFLLDAAAGLGTVTANNVMFKNINFIAGYADIAQALTITGKGCMLDSCRFTENTTNENYVDVIHAGVADNDYDGLVIRNCEFVMNDAAAVTAIDLLKNAQDVKIIGNRITGDFDASPYAPIYCAATEIQKNILVMGNLIHNVHNDNAAVGISIANTSSTGWIIYNHVGHQDVAGETPILAGAAGLYVGENYASGVLGTASGYLLPAVDS